MDNDDEIEGTLLSRRDALAVAARSGFALAMGRALATAGRAARPGAPTLHLLASPSATAGPFFVEEGLKRADLRAGSARPSILQAVPLRLEFRVYGSPDGVRFEPLRDAQVDVWHVDARGVYSDVPQGLNPEDTRGQNWLRGFQRTDAEGCVAFRTVFPGWYEGRATHVHFKVRYLLDGGRHAAFTSQLFVPDALADAIYARLPYRPRPADAVRNARDMVYRDGMAGGGHVGSVLTLDPKPSGQGYVARYNVALLEHPHHSNGSGRVPTRNAGIR